MTETQYRDGKFKLIRFVLSFPGGRVLPLTPYCARADIYESVLEPTAIAEFVISDKIGIFDHVNFLEQNITLQFTTYEDNEEAAIKYGAGDENYSFEVGFLNSRINLAITFLKEIVKK